MTSKYNGHCGIYLSWIQQWIVWQQSDTPVVDLQLLLVVTEGCRQGEQLVKWRVASVKDFDCHDHYALNKKESIKNSI